MAGLDLGSGYIKFLEVAGESLDQIRVLHYAIEPIPREWMAENGVYPNAEEISNLIRKCWKKSGSTTKQVVIAIPGAGCIWKKVQTPKMDLEADKLQQMEQEITRFLPEDTSVADLALDFSTIGDMVQSPTDEEIIIVAAKRDKIEDRVALIEAAGLEAVVLDMEFFAFQNMLRLMKGDSFLRETILLIDLSATSIRLIVYKKGELSYFKDAPIGGVSLTQELVTNFGINFVDAERMKFERGDDTYDMIVKAFLQNFASEFERMISYLASPTSIAEIHEVVVVGGMANLAGAEAMIKQVLSASRDLIIHADPVIGRPLSGADKDDKISLSRFARDEAGLFLVASLALRKYLRTY